MPRTSIDYSNTIIYKLCCKDISITDIYIGHTTDMIKRKYRHKQCVLKPELNGGKSKCYETIRANGGLDNWDMIQIEVYNAKDVNDAKARERYWIEEMKPSLNYEIPNRTWKERYINKRQERREYDIKRCKEYHEKNREVLNAKKREKVQCPHCPSLICRTGLARHIHRCHDL